MVKNFLRQYRLAIGIFVYFSFVAVVSGYIALRPPQTDIFPAPPTTPEITVPVTPTPATTTPSPVETKYIAPPVPIARSAPSGTSSPPPTTSLPILTNITLQVPNYEYTIPIPPGSSVYELMQAAEKITNFHFTGKDYGPGLGFFVEEINGVRNDPKQRLYWIYKINGEKAKVGVSTYHIQSNDTIEWIYEKEQY